eukprot:scaffold5544_cov126-Skeletonema_dohrnii-CCMP3373.AAC.8
MYNCRDALRPSSFHSGSGCKKGERRMTHIIYSAAQCHKDNLCPARSRSIGVVFLGSGLISGAALNSNQSPRAVQPLACMICRNMQKTLLIG